MQSRVSAWALAQGVELRDAVVLLPFAQLLGIARRAFAEAGGWMPRLETTQTLARSLAPATAPHPTQICFDVGLDRLSAARMLRAQRWAVADAADFDAAVATLVDTAHALARAAAAVAPARRDAHWAAGRLLLGAVGGPGARERWLARVAFEWAAAGAAPASDALFALRPSAWVVVRSGGTDALAEAVLAAAPDGTPCLCIDADLSPHDPFACVAATAAVEVAACGGFEDEAQRCAAHVIDHLNAGRAPVAVIASDRSLVRRVRALLARQQLPLLDETGWKLSTTRAGSVVAGLLRAALPGAATDSWLDCIKSGAFMTAPGDGAALAAVEAEARRRGWSLANEVEPATLPGAAATLWQRAAHVLAGFDAPRTRSVGEWLQAVAAALRVSGQWDVLCRDDAGRQLLAALHLAEPAVPAALQQADGITLAGFTRWVDAVMEDASFRPAAPAEAAVVVVTPLERAMLRPFGAVVFPAADAKRLGAPVAPQALLGDATAVALGLPGVAARREAETLAFAQLLRAPALTLLYRSDDGGEPLVPSPLVERLRLAITRAGGPRPAPPPDPRPVLTIEPQPVARPLPVAPGLLPARLSASACEALRECPYRFFALHLLGLRAADELDNVVEKRDYGTWLHAVLHRFHRDRGEPGDSAAERVRLFAIGDAVRRELALDDAAFLPFAASFALLAPAYLAWLHARDAAGVQWNDGERSLQATPDGWPAGIAMHGVVDRIDTQPGEPPTVMLIDYKTGSASKLRTLAKSALEDTQLVFYAALLAHQGDDADSAIEAGYLPLDDREVVKLVPHEGVEADAQDFVEGMGRDLARLRGGAALPALGEGSACTHCDARGLCRRDHWAAAPATAVSP